MKEIILTENFSQSLDGEVGNNAKAIVFALEELGKVSASGNAKYSSLGLFNEDIKMDRNEYKEKNDAVKTAIIGFAAAQSGMDKIVKDVYSNNGLARCFQNTMFKEIFNSIITEAISGVVVNSNPVALLALCTIVDVNLNASYSLEIEPKGLPVAQRSSYGTNVTLLDGYTTQSITIVPKPYTVGSQIDFIRIGEGGYDFGKEVARVSMALVYTQYRLVVGILFDSTPLADTPFFSPTYSGSKVVDMVSNLQAVNGGAAVKAYGTLPAFNKAGTISTTNFGFETQDEMVRNGFIGRANGIENIAIAQATDLSIPFTNTSIDESLLLKNNMILLVSEVNSKPVTLVRENFIHVHEHDANHGSLRRLTYSYTQSFDAALATQANYGIIQVA